MTRAQMLVALLSLLCGACFDPEPKLCMPCIETCPTGQTCHDNMCEAYQGQCTTTSCDETCCIDEACFDLKRHMPPDSLALWLDWTSLYETESSPIWRDRSAQAYTFSSEKSNAQLASQSQPQWNTLRLASPGAHVALSGEEQYKLDSSDFLLMVAGSLSCEPTNTDAEQCVVSRVKTSDVAGQEVQKEGLRLCTTRSATQESHFDTGQENAEPQFLSALVTGVACNQMQLFTLSRSSPEGPDAGSFSSQFELRQNAETKAQTELDARLSLEVESSLRIGGRKKSSYFGDVALVALIVGKVGARERCELERFVLERLAAADMPSAAELPDCSGL